MNPRAAAATLALGLSLGCGKEVPHGGVPKSAVDAPRRGSVVEGTDLIPGDLDVVVRIDLSQVRRHLGESSARELIDKALEEAGSAGVLREALASAEVVHVGLRVADFEAGDRVMVVTASQATAVPDQKAWKKADEREEVVRYDARRSPPRNGIERIFRMGERQLVFVSPVETMSVQRVLERGPDARRGQPQARGLVSLDYRASRLSPALDRRFPSLSSLIGGVDRMSASLDLVGGQLELEGRIRCKSPAAANKVLRFLETIREAGKRSERFGALLGGLTLDRGGSSVQLRWPLPREVVAGWIHGPNPASPE